MALLYYICFETLYSVLLGTNGSCSLKSLNLYVCGIIYKPKSWIQPIAPSQILQVLLTLYVTSPLLTCYLSTYKLQKAKHCFTTVNKRLCGSLISYIANLLFKSSNIDYLKTLILYVKHSPETQNVCCSQRKCCLKSLKRNNLVDSFEVFHKAMGKCWTVKFKQNSNFVQPLAPISFIMALWCLTWCPHSYFMAVLIMKS